MSEQTPNPYMSPTSASPQADGSTSLLPAWIWLAVVILAPSMLAPADPISVMLTAAAGWFCFIAGAIQASKSLPSVFRLTLFLALTLPAAAFAFIASHSYLMVGLLIYAVAGAALGYSFGRRVRTGKVRIVGYFVVGFFLGSLLVGAVGAVAGAVLGVKLAQRRIRSIPSQSASPA